MGRRRRHLSGEGTGQGTSSPDVFGNSPIYGSPNYIGIEADNTPGAPFYGTPQHLQYASQGMSRVPGQGAGDTVPAMLTPGEAVLTRGASELLGRDTVDRLNALAEVMKGGDGGPSAPNHYQMGTSNAGGLDDRTRQIVHGVAMQYGGRPPQGFQDGTADVQPPPDAGPSQMDPRIKQIVHQVAMQHGGRPPEAMAGVFGPQPGEMPRGTPQQAAQWDAIDNIRPSGGRGESLPHNRMSSAGHFGGYPGGFYEMSPGYGGGHSQPSRSRSPYDSPQYLAAHGGPGGFNYGDPHFGTNVPANQPVTKEYLMRHGNSIDALTPPATQGGMPPATTPYQAMQFLKQMGHGNDPHIQALIPQVQQHLDDQNLERFKKRLDVTKEEAEIQEKQTNAGFSAGAAAAGQSGQSGEAYLKTLPSTIQTQVRAIIEGRAPYPTGFLLKTPYGQQLAAAVTQADPTFEVGKAGSRIQVRKEFTSGGPNSVAGMITAGNTAIQHLGRIGDEAEKMGNYQMPLVNKARNFALKQSGEGTHLIAFQNAVDRFNEEATKFYRGLGGTQADIERGLINLDPSMSPAQIQTSIATQAELMQSKIEQLQDRWKTGMGPMVPDFEIVKPESQTTMKSIMSRAGKAGAATGGQAPLPEGYTPEMAISEAKKAIASGKDPDWIANKLKEHGIDPELLGSP